MKKSLTMIISLILMMNIALTGCSNTLGNKSESNSSQNLASDSATQSAESGQLELTLDELAKYNGQNGNPSYVAVDGVIYDVSDLGKWSGGQHEGLHQAGTDLTQAIKESPHGNEILSRAKIVGKLK